MSFRDVSLLEVFVSNANLSTMSLCYHGFFLRNFPISNAMTAKSDHFDGPSIALINYKRLFKNKSGLRPCPRSLRPLPRLPQALHSESRKGDRLPND
mmetsp:Transcript_3174/g.6589  ORF Transcript_3174/g.6589 Transcript_3174/m.6589 type:complete len:97 (+) Transcript_3174:286-576(+)